MTRSSYYLKQNVVAEPLVDSWYAWAHLMPPTTLSRNITERHLKIMDSYIESPETHEAAVKDPKLLGGPFMDLKQRQVEKVAELREHTLRERNGLITLSRAIQELDALLRHKAAGFSLEPLYSEVPEALRGYVELVYDLNNQPSFRLFEPLLYKSAYYDTSLQTMALSEISGDDRPFVLSTPRLDDGDSLQLRIPFASDALDVLFRMKHVLTSEEKISEAVSVLLDPVLSYTYESDISRYTYEDLPEVIDYVLITHNHQDHILFETLLQLRHRIRHIVVPRNCTGALQDPSLKLLLQQCGFRNVIEISEMEEIPFPQGSITALPFLGEHGDLNVLTKSVYLLRMGKHKLLFAADSCNVSPEVYRYVHDDVGDVDALFVGMECDGAPMSWIYGPLLTQKLERQKDHSRRLAGSNYERALSIVEQFRCKEVYVYALGQEPWLNYIMSIKYTGESNPITHSNRLMETCQTRGITAERLFGEKEIFLD